MRLVYPRSNAFFLALLDMATGPDDTPKFRHSRPKPCGFSGVPRLTCESHWEGSCSDSPGLIALPSSAVRQTCAQALSRWFATDFDSVEYYCDACASEPTVDQSCNRHPLTSGVYSFVLMQRWPKRNIFAWQRWYFPGRVFKSRLAKPAAGSCSPHHGHPFRSAGADHRAGDREHL